MTWATLKQAKKLKEVADELEEYANALREAAEARNSSDQFLAFTCFYDIGDALASISPILDALDGAE